MTIAKLQQEGPADGFMADSVRTPNAPLRSGDPRWRWKGSVSSEMRRLMRARRVRSCEEGRAEREHERLAEREEPHRIKDSPKKGQDRL